MAEISKGKRSTGRRSSILKRALADIDVNVKEKIEVIKSKRVSFAETCCVKEFPRDSPQILKAAEHNDSADTSADISLQETDAVPDTNHPPKQKVAQPLVDSVAGSSFALDDGETSFIGDMAYHGNFCESTRCFDRVDRGTFGDTGGLDVSEITQGESSVFVSAPPTRNVGMAVICSTTTVHSNTVDVGQVQSQPTDRAAMQQVMMKGAPEMDFPGGGNRTVFFDDEDGGTMDLTLVDTSRTDLPIQNSPKVSARAFLNKIKAGRTGSGVPQAKEEQTVVFSNTSIDGAMELTQNLPQHNLTSDFRVVPRPFKPLADLQNSEFVPKDEARYDDEVISEDIPKISARSFLATLRQNLASMPASTAAPESTAPNGPGIRVSSSDLGQSEQREDGDMTMELTCTVPVDKPISQALSSSMVFQPVQPQTKKYEQAEASPDIMQHEENATEMMELTGCVDSTHQLLVEANISGITAPSVPVQGETKQSSGQHRNALMDITARYSISPPTTAAETEPSQNPGRPVEHVSQTTAVEQAIAAALPHQQRNSFTSRSTVESGGQNKTTTAFIGQENVGVHTRSLLVTNNQDNRIPLKPLQKDTKPSSASSPLSFPCPTNPSGCVSYSQYPLSSQDAPNRTVHFAADESMEITHGFVSSIDHISTSNQGINFETATTGTSYSMNRHQNSLTTTPAQQEVTVFGKDEAKDDKNKKQKDDQKDVYEMTVAFNTEDSAANMSLTCTTLPHTVPQERSSVNRTVMFNKEETAGNMSFTCALPEPSAPLDEQWSHKTILFGEETGANMSLTCTGLPSKLASDRSLANRSIPFRAEETAADTRMTCVDLQLSKEKSIKNKTENSVADKSLTHTNLLQIQSDHGNVQTADVVPVEKLQPLETRIVFAKEATAANMSLTYVDLPAVEQKETACHENCQTIAFKSEGGDSTQTTNIVSVEKHQSSEKSIVFAKEATAANMSLTCVDLPVLQNKESEPTPCNNESQLVTSVHKPVQHQEEDKAVTFTADESVAAMAMTESVGEIIESVKQQTRVISSSDNTAAQVNKTSALTSVEYISNAQNNTSAHSTAVSDCSKENLVKEVEEEVDSDDVLFKREPTTLMEITGILKNLQKKMEECGSSEETRAEDVTAQAENRKLNSCSPVQSNPENIKTVASRKLQLSSATGTKITDMFNSQTNKREDYTLPCTSRRRSSQSSDMGNEIPLKARRLSSQTVSASQSACLSAANKDPETDPKTSAMEVEDRSCKTDDSIFVAPKSKGTTETPQTQMQSRSCSSSSSNSTNSLLSTDICRETMPAFGQTASNTSVASMSVLSMSAMQNITGSFLSLGRSFVEKQEKLEEGSSFLQACEQLGIMQSDLKGWVCRRSSVADRPEVSCDTVEDQLNSASIVKQECESKVEFVSEMDAILQREEAASEELEKMVMRQITELGLVAKAEQSPSLRQQVRGLLLAGRKHAQVLWKTHKAEKLNTLAQKMENHNQAVSKDIQAMTTSIEHMVTVKENVDESISQLQVQLESLRVLVSSRKQGTKDHLKQQELQQQRSDLTSLQEQVSEAKCSLDRLTQKEEDLQAERRRARQSYEDSLERQKQLTQSYDTLFALHCLHCWRPVRVEEQRVDFLLLHDAVRLSVTLTGSSSSSQPIANITVTNQLKDGSEPWAVLATELTVDTLSASSQNLVHIFPSRQHLQQLLNEVTRLVEDIKGLCQEVKLAFLRHRITVKGKQITAEMWNIDRLRKVLLNTDIPVNSYPCSPLTWNTQVIMGDISDRQLQTTIMQVGAGKEHFTQVLQAVQTLLKQ